jgi:hypothetical protein
MIAKLRESSTFVLVVVHLGLYNYLVLAGSIKPTALEYAGGFAAIASVWLGREWRKAHYDGSN